MKKNKAWIFLSMVVLVAGCQNDDEKANAITSEEAALLISTSLASNTSGVSFVSVKAADVTTGLLADNAGGRVEACGLSQNIDLSGSSPNGATVSYSYDFSYKFKLNCNTESLPADVSVTLSYSGAFDGPKLSAEHTGLADLSVTGLEETAAEFLLNGMYKRTGSFENKELGKSGNSTIEVTLKDVIIDKQTRKIVSGTGSYALSGTVPDKGDFNYSGSITFDGADFAELDVKGAKFNSNLKNGEVSKKN